MKLRNYQKEIFDNVMWATSNDIVQLDTGAGKTPIEAAICEAAKFSCFVAHRNILIQQASEKLAAFGLCHDTISSEHTRRQCMAAHRPHGQNYIKRGFTERIVASIGSLVSHYKRGKLGVDRELPWLIVIDEAHHVVPDNQWGALREIFPNARFVGFTATPARMDGESLSVRNGGFFDRLVQTDEFKKNSIEKLIKNGFLSGFVAYSPSFTINKFKSSDELEIAADPIESYREHLHGRQAIVMCPTIANANELAERFVLDGTPAACINSHMSANDVSRLISMFATNRINVLCNVDMIGEGFDCPAVEGLIMMRKTSSFVMYKQWIGRALRISQNKRRAVIIDLVGNIAEHGLPDEHVEWDIDKPPRVPQSQIRAPCVECGAWYPVKLEICPECGYENGLINRNEVGRQYLKIKRIDTGLIERCRRELSEKKYQDKLDNEIVYPHDPLFGTIGKLSERIRVAFVDGLISAAVPIKDINIFLYKTRGIDFWIKNFTAADAGNMDARKIERVFKKWQKSN